MSTYDDAKQVIAEFHSKYDDELGALHLTLGALTTLKQELPETEKIRTLIQQLTWTGEDGRQFPGYDYNKETNDKASDDCFRELKEYAEKLDRFVATRKLQEDPGSKTKGQTREAESAAILLKGLLGEWEAERSSHGKSLHSVAKASYEIVAVAEGHTRVATENAGKQRWSEKRTPSTAARQ